ncbi:MAG TPA: DUF4157 domain-containing protein [Polyangia bacterium]|nr:DUF4157 domain-containing protein [Polyangia bacterium]
MGTYELLRRPPSAAKPSAAKPAATKSRIPDGIPLLNPRRAEPQAQGPAPPARSDIRVSNPSDPAEREADRIAADLERGPVPSPALLGLPKHFRGPTAPRGVAALSSGGVPLSAGAREFYEPRLGQSLADVRVHTGPTAASTADAFQAHAFAYGDHVFLGAGQRAEPSPLLAHELAHVAQQRASGRLLVARQAAPADDPDRNVHLPLLDSAVFAEIASRVLGDVEFAVFRELLRGAVGALQAEPEKLHQILAKFTSMTLGDQIPYAEGLVIGIGEGFWSSLKGLFEGIFALVKLPFELEQFLAVKLPGLVQKYGPRLIQLAGESDQIAGEIRQLVGELLADKGAAAAQLQKLLAGVRDLALGKVREAGHEAVHQLLAFLAEKDWKKFGEDVGQIVGMVLFEVLLAVGTDAIGNLAKEGGEVVARLAARVGSAAEGFAATRRFVTSALQALERLGGRVAGKLAELIERLKSVLRRLGSLVDEMLGEAEAVGPNGVRARIPEPPPKPNVLEARAHKPPGHGGPKVEDLKPPKVHPSKAEPAPKPRESSLSPSLTPAPKDFDIVSYSTPAPGFEKHHGVLDTWAQANVPGYQGTKAPTIVLTREQHNATRAVFNRWRSERGLARTPINWTQISAADIQSLTYRMLEAADVPPEVATRYIGEFNRFIYQR